jgi:hypothetical protein
MSLAHEVWTKAKVAEEYRADLLHLKAMIEGTQTNEVRGHFTKNRPMAEMAMIYAAICSSLGREA